METDVVFRALADPSRRLLLDRLFERDGQTLGDLCAHLPSMTRFGVMSHLRVLEDGGLVRPVKVGREKRHYLDPVPIRLIHDRWISRYAAPVVGALAALKAELEEETPMAATAPAQASQSSEDARPAPAHVYSVYIKATPERIWQAITDGAQTERYYYGTRVASDWKVGSPVTYAYPDGSVAADGEVLEIDPPGRLRLTFHARWDPEMAAEGPVTQTWTIEATDGGASLVTVTSEGLGPKTERDFTGGMVFIVSGLKTLLETGEPMAA